MGVYTIKDLEQLSGIKAHTIRIWEKRYGITSPDRGPGNVRIYSDLDLVHLLNISFLNSKGIKISKLASLSGDELSGKIAALHELNVDSCDSVDALTLSLLELDEEKFSKFISCNVEQIGFENTMLKVILPLLDKLSYLWVSGTTKPIQENFIINLIKRKILGAMELLPLDLNKRRESFLLFSPAGEEQELSLFFIQYLLKRRSFEAVFAGSNLSVEDVEHLGLITHPEFVYTIINDLNFEIPVKEYIKQLSLRFPESTILISGILPFRECSNPPKNVKVLNGLQDTLGFIENLI